MCLHVVFVFLGYCVVGLAYFFLPRTTNPGTESAVMSLIVGFLASLGLISGLGLMIGRRGQTESVALAISTIAAFVLLFLTSY